MLLALLAMAFGAVNANADETISLQEVPFTTWSDYGAAGSAGDPADCLWVIGEGSTNVYGDPSVINGADLSLYTQLVIRYTEGTPRVLLNRDVAEGQWNADEAQSKLIEYPKDGWSQKYFNNNTEEGILTVDLKSILKDKGYVRLHAIKGANWANVVITSMEVVRKGNAQQVGWTNLINNGNMEGDDASSIFQTTNYAVNLARIGVEDGNVSSFYSKENAGDPYASIIEDGVGVNGSRGIKIHSGANAANDWDAQFWINASEDIPAGTKLRVSFDYRASIENDVDAQAHGTPSCYIFYNCIGANPLHFTTDWQTYTWEGEVPTDWATQDDEDKSNFHSIAFNLSKDRANDVDYFFDNIKLEVYKYGTSVEYGSEIIQVDFGFDTNIADLVKASGKPRLLFPNDCVKVTHNGEEMGLLTVEGFADGRFFIFTEDMMEEDAEVEVSFTNPSDAEHHVVYTSGPKGDASNFSVVATYNDGLNMLEDVYSYIFVKPTVIASDPEDGSFNLPNDIKEFKVTFDKNADLAKLVATLNGKALAVTPNEGFGTEVTLTRSGDNLADGAYILKLDKIYCEDPLVEEDFATWTATLNVGKVEYDPNDVVKVLVKDNFGETQDGFIPAGWTVVFNGNPRDHETNVGSGPRNFIFPDGGDFKGALYYRTDNAEDEGYVMYGAEEGYDLTLEAGKTYNVKFADVAWKGTPYAVFEIMDANDNVVYSRIDACTPTVNNKDNPVKGSNVIEFKYIPEVTGNYRLKWTPAVDAKGTKGGGMVENLLANVEVKYMPNQVGLEETQLLNTALENAKTVRDENSAERYNGAAYDALVAAINKYDAEKDGYTNPSSYRNAAADLDAKAKAMKDHRTLCDHFDTAANSAAETMLNNAETKFANTELFAKLKAIVDKYVTFETREDGVYTIVKPVKDDAELTAAIAEMKDIVSVAKYFFTEGESKTSSDVGVKVLVDRIRQGAEGLLQLGVPEDDEIIVAANNALTDDDALAEALKNRLKLEFYGKQKDGASLFEPTGELDPETDEPLTQTYNFTAFVKNPNTYAWKEALGVTEENCPGWTIVEGGTCGLTSMWNGGYPGDIDGLPKDLCITQYHHANRIEQTIEDLPAGVYTVMIDATEWSDEFTPKEGDTEEQIAEKEANHEQNRAYVKTSDTPVYVEGEEEQFKASARLDNRGQYAGRYENFFKNIEVVDGVLTLGVKWNALAQMMFDRVQIFLAGAASGYDYAKAYEDVLTGVDAANTNAKTVSIQVYDLNGRRLYNAQKGINIVRKQMSDGTIRTEKVVVK